MIKSIRYINDNKMGDLIKDDKVIIKNKIDGVIYPLDIKTNLMDIDTTIVNKKSQTVKYRKNIKIKKIN